MSINFELIRLTTEAKNNIELRNQLLWSVKTPDPMKNFSQICINNGFEIYLGELFAYGEDMNDSKLRSVNGGGVNAIEGWNDAFAQIIKELEEMNKD